MQWPAYVMRVHISRRPLDWASLSWDKLEPLQHDWHGAPISRPLHYKLCIDNSHLWFAAIHQSAPYTHPDAVESTFTPELWKYDLAELFLSNPERNAYLELNLAANGAWWSAEFASARQLNGRCDTPIPGIQTYHKEIPNSGWAAAMAIPLAELKATLGFPENAHACVCSITSSPDQQLATATPLPGDTPDFHQPKHFQKLQIQ
ncbi:hypothetical protein [Rubritalea marina]|uniref:hypothetical protein n=1 Tax=Rubritalea marina TaxID=361055 RepID=UPI0012EA60FE|nr:hypothetical protein [Rubritalea marina]